MKLISKYVYQCDAIPNSTNFSFHEWIQKFPNDRTETLNVTLKMGKQDNIVEAIVVAGVTNNNFCK